ncbi:hypothetical protein NW762_006355 [Fusarium torreyae]|uniref:Kinesin light chain n=1 Tax=Fusarium torreyae TaxID=1237075 RepID=A0A9W8S2S3_9HYPO|nr:hypothetical protein NW762_006355 [Fusarium torreyae]
MSKQRPERHLKNIVLSTRGILFLGTPHHGSGLARWAERLSRHIGLIKHTNPNILEVLRRESEVLARIQDSFHTMIKARATKDLSPIDITCFYEELPLPGIGLVVPQDSAILPGYIPIGIHEDHMGMTKFAHTDDPGFVAVCGELQRWTKEANAAERSNAQNNKSGHDTPDVVGAGLDEAPHHTFVNTGHALRRVPIFNVPFDQDPDFVDRPDITIWLYEQYMGPTSRMALVGMGGFGKSQLAIHFAYHIRDISPQTNIYWVYASSKPRFEEAYRSIAEMHQLPKRNDPDTNVLELVRDWLITEEAGSWLMILDNADDIKLFYPTHVGGEKAATELENETTQAKSNQRPLAAYLPKRGNGIIFVTSRSMDAAERLTGSQKAILRVPTMDEARGLQLFRNKLCGPFDRGAAIDLLRALDHIPLAITQAAAYINRRAPRISVKAYLDTFNKSDKKKGNLLNKDAGDLRRDETVSNSVVITWQVTFEQIRLERPSAAKLLSFMSFFNPQQIPEFVLNDYSKDLVDLGESSCSDSEIDWETGSGSGSESNLESDSDSDNFEDDLDLLRGYSLVSVTERRDTCEMHNLVQFCTRVWITAMGDETRWKLMFLHSMSKHFPCDYYDTWPVCQRLFPHLEATLEEEPPSEGWEDWMNLLENCATYMSHTGNYQVAADLIQKAIDISTTILGKEHIHTILKTASLAEVYTQQGRLKVVEELQVRAVSMLRKLLGEEHNDTQRAMCNLAVIYRHQGLVDRAQQLLEETFETTKKALGEEHADTLVVMQRLVVVYEEQGQLEKAEELQESALAVQKIMFGEENIQTLIGMTNLAVIFRDQGRFKEAEELGSKVLEICRNMLGEEHHFTLTTTENLAMTYLEQGRSNEAEELGTRVADELKRILGEEHPSTLVAMDVQAMIWRSQGRTGDALNILRKVTTLRQRVLGEDHPLTKWSIRRLAKWEDNNDPV